MLLATLLLALQATAPPVKLPEAPQPQAEILVRKNSLSVSYGETFAYAGVQNTLRPGLSYEHRFNRHIRVIVSVNEKGEYTGVIYKLGEW